MKKTLIGGQAVMEGVMMRSPEGVALAVRRTDGAIVKEYHKNTNKRKKGSFATWPVVRGVVVFVESLVSGMKIVTRSAELMGEGFEEEPSKFEKWLAKRLGKSAMDVALGVAVVLALILSVGLFIALPALIVGWLPLAEHPVWESLAQGLIRLIIFLAYLVAVSLMKDVKRMFQYHGAEHKTIACYEHDLPLTPANAKTCSRFHPRCGTNFLFLVMAISILFFAVVTALTKLWLPQNSFILRFAIRLLFLPLVAGLSYEVLRGAAKSDNIFCRIVRAPGMALQRLTTKEPDEEMLEVAIASFQLAEDPPDHDIEVDTETEKAKRIAKLREDDAQNETAAEAEPAKAQASSADTAAEPSEAEAHA